MQYSKQHEGREMEENWPFEWLLELSWTNTCPVVKVGWHRPYSRYVVGLPGPADRVSVPAGRLSVPANDQYGCV